MFYVGLYAALGMFGVVLQLTLVLPLSGSEPIPNLNRT
jgi:hypothetical protein